MTWRWGSYFWLTFWYFGIYWNLKVSTLQYVVLQKNNYKHIYNNIILDNTVVNFIFKTYQYGQDADKTEINMLKLIIYLVLHSLPYPLDPKELGYLNVFLQYYKLTGCFHKYFLVLILIHLWNLLNKMNIFYRYILLIHNYNKSDPSTYIKSGLKWWTRAQNAIPFLHDVVILSICTSGQSLINLLHHSSKAFVPLTSDIIFVFSFFW